MPIMAAGMHDAFGAAGMGKPCRFVNGQGVHISAKTDNTATTPLFQAGDDTRSGNAMLHLIAKGGQMGDDQIAGALFLKGQFRILMEFPPKGDDLIQIGTDLPCRPVLDQGTVNGDVHGCFQPMRLGAGCPFCLVISLGQIAAFTERQAEMIAQRVTL